MLLFIVGGYCRTDIGATDEIGHPTGRAIGNSALLALYGDRFDSKVRVRSRQTDSETNLPQGKTANRTGH